MEERKFMAKPELTVAEVEKMEGHVELVDGRLIIENRTSWEHNQIATQVQMSLEKYIESGHGKCVTARENVALYVNELDADLQNHFFLPDIMVICKSQDKIDSKGVHTVPDFVAEITSEATRCDDYTTKLYVYSKIGVSEYWIIDTQRKIVVKYLAEDYSPIVYPFGKIPVSIYKKELVIDLSGILSF